MNPKSNPIEIPTTIDNYYVKPFVFEGTRIGAKCILGNGILCEYVGEDTVSDNLIFRNTDTNLLFQKTYTGGVVPDNSPGHRIYLIVDNPIAPGHNPHKLHPNQIPAGWRLLNSLDEPFDKRAKFWAFEEVTFLPYSHIGLQKAIYHCRDTTIIPINPPKKLPLSAEDFPPGTAIRKRVLDYYELVLCTSDKAISSINRVHSYTNEAFMNMYQRLLPGTTEWLPCYKEE